MYWFGGFVWFMVVVSVRFIESFDRGVEYGRFLFGFVWGMWIGI